MIFRLIVFTILPVITTTAILLFEKKSGYKKVGFWKRQIIIGILFGIIACLATQFGSHIGDADINVRNAAPLTAGLVFGPPAGIITGVIGAVYRYFSVLWGVAEYTQLACTISTLLSGFIGALGYKLFISQNKRFFWIYGTVFSAISEAVHMLLIFFTKPNDSTRAFLAVEQCAIPMFLACAVSVALALSAAEIILSKTSSQTEKRKKSVSDAFQIGLIICVLVGTIISGALTYKVNDTIETEGTHRYIELAEKKLEEHLNLTTRDTAYQHISVCNHYYENGVPAEMVFEIAAPYMGQDELPDREANYPLIFFTDPDRKCISTSDSDMIAVGERVSDNLWDIFDIPFNTLSEEESGIHVSDFDPETQRRYCAKQYDDGSCLFVICGPYSTLYMDVLKTSDFAQTQSIGESGFMLIVNDGKVISDGRPDAPDNQNDSAINFEFPSLEDIGFLGTEEDFPLNEFVVRDVFGEESFCMRKQYVDTFGTLDGLFILPVAEMVQARNAAVYSTVLMQILIFAMVFVMTYLVSDRVIIKKIGLINNSLTKIAAGDLQEFVNVREYEEFDSLSNDINATVDSLKSYIDEANSRLDKELAFAKEIQEAALPDMFPPYPNRKDFDIFALMDAAKTVGGDFYDLYLLDRNHLVFLVADVSGKSIPGAMFMMRAKTIIKSMAEKNLDVDEIFTAANSYLFEGNRTKMFVTCWMGIVDMRSGILSFANAGHNPPLIRRRNGQFESLKTKPNFVLAGKKNISYQRHEIQLQPGDELFLYTDGVTEAMNEKEQLFGEERLIGYLNENADLSVEGKCLGVKKKVEEFVGESEQFDDITMLSVCFNSFADIDHIITLPNQGSAETVWNFICDKLMMAKVSTDCAHKVQIIVDEIYSNTIRYSEADIAEILIDLSTNELQLIFKNDGIPYDPLAQPDPDVSLRAKQRKIGGLGIFMVKKLSNFISYRYEDGFNILSVGITLTPEDKQ